MNVLIVIKRSFREKIVKNACMVGVFSLVYMACISGEGRKITLPDNYSTQETIESAEVLLFEAIQKNDLNGVKNALKQGADPKKSYRFEQKKESRESVLIESKTVTALRFAIENTPYSIDIIALLLDNAYKKADPEESYSD
jgi:hypothetical protein